MANHSKSERHSKSELHRPSEIRTCSVFQPPLYFKIWRHCRNLIFRIKEIWKKILGANWNFWLGKFEIKKTLQSLLQNNEFISKGNDNMSNVIKGKKWTRPIVRTQRYDIGTDFGKNNTRYFHHLVYLIWSLFRGRWIYQRNKNEPSVL